MYVGLQFEMLRKGYSAIGFRILDRTLQASMFTQILSSVVNDLVLKSYRSKYKKLKIVIEML